MFFQRITARDGDNFIYLFIFINIIGRDGDDNLFHQVNIYKYTYIFIDRKFIDYKEA